MSKILSKHTKSARFRRIRICIWPSFFWLLSGQIRSPSYTVWSSDRPNHIIDHWFAEPRNMLNQMGELKGNLIWNISHVGGEDCQTFCLGYWSWQNVSRNVDLSVLYGFVQVRGSGAAWLSSMLHRWTSFAVHDNPPNSVLFGCECNSPVCRKNVGIECWPVCPDIKWKSLIVINRLEASKPVSRCFNSWIHLKNIDWTSRVVDPTKRSS